MSKDTPLFVSDFKITKTKDNSIEVNGISVKEIISDIQNNITPIESVGAPRIIKNIHNINFTKEQIDKVIKEILRCNICYNIIQNPVCVKGCLHKFCKSCISNYIFKIKKECAICRHPVETKRLLIEDNRMSEIIKCFIQNLEEFSNEEDKLLQEQVKTSEKLNQINLNKQLDLLKNKDNSKEKGFIEKKSERDKTNNNYKEKNKNGSQSIICKIIYEGVNNKLSRSFKDTKIKVDDNKNLDFISRFICYKEGLKSSFIKKLMFYTYDELKKKKEWNHTDLLQNILNFEKENKDIKIVINKNNNDLYKQLNHLDVYFDINESL